MCKKIKEEVARFPIFISLLEERILPNLSYFKLPIEEEQALLEDLKKSLKGKNVPVFDSENRGTKMRARQAQYRLNKKKYPVPEILNSFLADYRYISREKLIEALMLAPLLSTNPRLTYTPKGINPGLQEEILSMVEELDPSEVYLVDTANHAMLLFQESNNYYFFDPNRGVLKFLDHKRYASFVSEACAALANGSINEYKASFEHYEEFFVIDLNVFQWNELAMDGICASFSLDLAEQLLLGIREGKKIAELLNIQNLGYQDFWVSNHLQTTVESYLDRSQFLKAVEEWDTYKTEDGNIRTYLSYLIAKGNAQADIATFQEAESVLELIPYLEEMPGENLPKKRKWLEERKQQIAKGIELAQKGIIQKPFLQIHESTQELPNAKIVSIVPLRLK